MFLLRRIINPAQANQAPPPSLINLGQTNKENPQPGQTCSSKSCEPAQENQTIRQTIGICEKSRSNIAFCTGSSSGLWLRLRLYLTVHPLFCHNMIIHCVRELFQKNPIYSKTLTFQKSQDKNTNITALYHCTLSMHFTTTLMLIIFLQQYNNSYLNWTVKIAQLI